MANNHNLFHEPLASQNIFEARWRLLRGIEILFVCIFQQSLWRVDCLYSWDMWLNTATENICLGHLD